MDLIGRKIFIVEDDGDIREILKDFFEAEGCLVFAATNGREGIELFETQGKPDLVLLDLMMPVMSGEEFVHQLKQTAEWADTPIVIMSADLHTSKIAEMLKIERYVRKPIALRSLVAMAEEAMNA